MIPYILDKPPVRLLVMGRFKQDISEKTARLLVERVGMSRLSEPIGDQKHTLSHLSIRGGRLDVSALDRRTLRHLIQHPANPLEADLRTLQLLSRLVTKEDW